MAAKVYVGNLSWNTNDDSLRQAFGEFGQVTDSIVMQDRETGRSRGFGFVTFSSADEAQAAIAGMHDQDLDGRRIKVNLANDRPSGGSRGGGGGYQQQGGYLVLPRGRGTREGHPPHLAENRVKRVQAETSPATTGLAHFARLPGR